MWSILHIELRKKTIISLNNSIPPHIICVTFLLIMQLLWSFCLAKKKRMKKKNSQNCQFYVQKKRWYFSLYFIVWSSSEIHCVPAKKIPQLRKKRSFFRKNHHLTFFSSFFLDIYCIINCVFPPPWI